MNIEKQTGVSEFFFVLLTAMHDIETQVGSIWLLPIYMEIRDQWETSASAFHSMIQEIYDSGLIEPQCGEMDVSPCLFCTVTLTSKGRERAKGLKMKVVN